MIKHKVKHDILKLIKNTERQFLELSFQELPDSFRRSIIERLDRIFVTCRKMQDGECDCEPAIVEPVKLEDAFEYLADGHTLFSPGLAAGICQAVGVEYDNKLIYHGYSDFMDGRGLHMADGNEGQLGVYALDLSAHVARKLNVYDKAPSLMGRGSQAQAYAREIKKLFAERTGANERKNG